MKTPNEIDAKGALEMMGQGQNQLTRAVLRSVGNYLILWGGIYVAVPLLIPFVPDTAGLTTNGLVLLGIITTIIMAIREPVKSELDSNIGKFWFVAFFFAVIWILLLAGKNFPNIQVNLSSRQSWAFGVTVAMMMFVLSGLLERSKMIMFLGFFVTVLTVTAFLSEWAWSVFWFWMSAFTGLPLLICGIWAKTANSKD